MESQLQHPSHGHHHHYEEDPQHAGLHAVIEGEGEQGDHPHNTSVLKKVKNKAKKIKDTIKKHGHGHGHEHEHGQEGGHRRQDIYQEGFEEEDDDDDEDEEIVNDPEVHGAPIYESTVIRSTNLLGETNMDVEKPKNMNKHEQNVRDEGIARPIATDPMTHEVERPPATAAHEPVNKNPPNVEEPKIKVGPGIGYSRPAEIPRSNYESEVADPTGDVLGGKEANDAPLVSQFDNLNVDDNVFDKKPEPEKRSYTGSRDQFAPQGTPTKTQFNPESGPANTPEKPDPNPSIQDPTNQDTFAGKISSATAAATSTAISAKNAVASKLGYGGGAQQGQDSSPKQPASVVSEYAEKVAEKFRPGDEDKALSEVITDAFTSKEERTAEGGRPRGRVTQSEEVAACLGPAAEKKREGEDALAAGEESSGLGVVDRLKDAVGGWLGKSTGMQTAQDSVGGSYVSDASSASSQAAEQGKEASDQQK